MTVSENYELAEAYLLGKNGFEKDRARGLEYLKAADAAAAAQKKFKPWMIPVIIGGAVALLVGALIVKAFIEGMMV